MVYAHLEIFFFVCDNSSMNSNLGDVPQQDVEYVKFVRAETPRKVFFYQRKDTEGDIIADSPIFACYEQEAGMYGKFHKMVGVGTGEAFYAYLKNAKVTEICPGCGGAKVVEQAVTKNGKTVFEKIPCAKCNGMGTHEKLLRANMIISVAESKRILQAAWDAEWEIAKGKKDKPVYQNVSFDDTIKQHKNAKSIMDSFNPSAD